MIDYEEKLILFLKKFLPHFQIILKEHPNFIGYRPPSLHRKIKKISKDILFLPTYLHISECIKISDLTFVWTGTAGFEEA